jgi:excisionase family DNA binding protein
MKTKQALKPFLTLKEAAELSRLAPSTIRLLFRQRKQRGNQVGRRVIIKTSDLEKFREANPIAAKPIKQTAH